MRIDTDDFDRSKLAVGELAVGDNGTSSEFFADGESSSGIFPFSKINCRKLCARLVNLTALVELVKVPTLVVLVKVPS